MITTSCTLYVLSLASTVVAAPMPSGPFLEATFPVSRWAEGSPPLVLNIDLADAALGMGLPYILADEVRLGVVQGEELVPVEWQLSPISGDKAIVYVVPPVDGASGEVRLRLFARRGPAFAQNLYSSKALDVEESDGVVTIRNSFYAVTHDPAKLGGLPSRIEFLHDGKVFEGYSLNDRLYSRDLGGFNLANDRDAKVEVVANGPLCLTVRVSAAYIGPNGPTETRARAEYLFSYFLSSPAFLVQATVTQEKPFAWDELHFIEINYPDTSFTSWMTKDSPAGGSLAADRSSKVSSGWAALTDGASVLGLIAPDALRIYDGRGEYGTYLHGPWVSWATERTSFQAYVYADATGGKADALAAIADGVGSARPPRVSTSLIDELTGKVSAAGAQGRWAAAVASGSARTGVGLGDAVVRLRAAANAVREGQDPVEASASAGERVRALGGGRIRAAVRQIPGGAVLASLWDAKVGRELLSGPGALFRAEFRDAEKRAISVDSSSGFGSASVDAEGDTLRVQFGDAKDARLAGTHATVVMLGDGDALRSALSIDAGEAVSLMSATPLTLDLAPLSEGSAGETPAPRDDYLVSPVVSGQLVRDPIGKGTSTSGQYPSGWTPVQMGAYYDARGGLYFACEDPNASTKDISTGASGGAIAVRMSFPAEDATVPGNGFRQPGETVLRLFDGDWFDAAGIYRDWVEGKAPWWPDADRPDTPQWVKDIAVWAQTGGGPEEVVEPVKRMAAYMGVPTALHWYSWHEIPFDVNYPHYFPTKLGVPEGVRELQAAGVRVMPYINGRLWDTALDDFKSTGIAAATKDEAGNPYIEEYGSGAKLAPMCPTQKLWRDTVRGIVLRLCGTEVGVDGVYIDQIAAAGPRLCMDKTHGHPLSGGSWWTVGGYWPLLTQLREELHALSPDKMTTTECNAEPYVHLMDGYLTWHFQYADQIPLFAAIYGGRVQLFGRAYNGDEQAVRMKAAQSLVWGEQIGWMSPTIIDHPVNGPYLRRVARMRYALRDFLATGTMEHPPMVEGDIPDVTCDWQWSGPAIRTYSALQAGAWRARDGRLAVILANIVDKPLTFTWTWDRLRYGPQGTPTLVREDGEVQGQASATTTLTLQPLEVVAYVFGG